MAAISKVGTTTPLVATGTTSVSPTWRSDMPRTAGNRLLARVAAYGANAITCGDGTWTAIGSEVVSGSERCRMWTKVASGGDAAPTFNSTSATFMEATLEEFTPGELQSDSIGTATYTSGSSLSVATATAPAKNGNLVASCFGVHGASSQTSTFTPGTGFTTSGYGPTTSAANRGGGAYDLDASTAGAVTEAASINRTIANGTCQIVVFNRPAETFDLAAAGAAVSSGSASIKVAGEVTLIVVADMHYNTGDVDIANEYGDWIATQNPDAVLICGDVTEGTGTLWTSSYDPHWGSFKAITHPVNGNHDHESSDYDSYWGSAAGTHPNHWYSFDLGSWHIIVLDSGVDCTSGSAQYNWLSSDLSAVGRSKPILVAWHFAFLAVDNVHPTEGDDMADAWALLQSYGADLAVAGHHHHYVRTKRINSSKLADPDGIREITGDPSGIDYYTDDGSVPDTVEAWISAAQGYRNAVILTLLPTSYSWLSRSNDAGFTPDSGGPIATHNPQGLSLAASGAAASSGSASLVAIERLAASGAAASTGAADLAIVPGVQTYPIAAAGAAISSGSAVITARLPISASGSATSSGSASLVARLPIAAAGAAISSGDANLGRLWGAALVASGAQASSGAAALAIVPAGPQTWGITASGTAASSGTADLGRLWAAALAASGAQAGSGSAVIVALIALAASGVRASSGSANWGGWTMALAASGAAQSSGSAGLIWLQALAAAGVAISSGSASLGRVWADALVASGARTSSGAAELFLVQAGTWLIAASGAAQSVGSAAFAVKERIGIHAERRPITSLETAIRGRRVQV